MLAVNDPPFASDKTVIIDEDSSYNFEVSDFGFQDLSDNDDLKYINIISVPVSGSLMLDAVPVVVGQQIAAADLASNQLVYTPLAHQHDSAYASFQFTVTDDGSMSGGTAATALQPNTIAFNVLSVNDGPSGTNGQIITSEDTDYLMRVTDFGFQDLIDGNALSTVSIVNITASSNCYQY